MRIARRFCRRTRECGVAVSGVQEMLAKTNRAPCGLRRSGAAYPGTTPGLAMERGDDVLEEAMAPTPSTSLKIASKPKGLGASALALSSPWLLEGHVPARYPTSHHQPCTTNRCLPDIPPQTALLTTTQQCLAMPHCLRPASLPPCSLLPVKSILAFSPCHHRRPQLVPLPLAAQSKLAAGSPCSCAGGIWHIGIYSCIMYHVSCILIILSSGMRTN
jgi:hypothetical protein